MLINIYPDGACSGNPGPGGWGVVLCYGDYKKTLAGAVADTTNNRMELLAAISGLQALTTKGSEVCIITDSKYVKDGITSWIKNWKKNNWRTASKQPVKNQDLWQQLDFEISQHKVTWQWVKGHSGHPENDLADSLARGAIAQVKVG